MQIVVSAKMTFYKKNKVLFMIRVPIKTPEKLQFSTPYVITGYHKVVKNINQAVIPTLSLQAAVNIHFTTV